MNCWRENSVEDLVIKNVKVVDFEDKSLIKQNIGIKNGKIHSISDHDITGKKIINANDCIASPGFIDIHNHMDSNFKLKELDPFETAKHLLLMGVTTAVGGNCGVGITNVKMYFDYIRKKGSPVNYIGFIGYDELRKTVGNNDVYKTSTKKQMKQMSDLANLALRDGAIGISFGLEYSPGTSFEEIIEICESLKQFPCSLISAHVRYDADRSLKGLAEMINVACYVNIPVQISHINSCVCFGYAKEGLKMIDEAIKRGLDITADAYPYNAFSTFAGSTVFKEGCFKRWNVDYDSIMVAYGKYQGQRCNKELFEYIRNNHPDALLIAFVMDQQEVDMVLCHPEIMIASDGIIEKSCGHPRVAGTFPRALYRYTAGKTEKDLINILEKMTKIPANRLGLKKKGSLIEGNDADIVIFNWHKIMDQSTFNNPATQPLGIDFVLIEGRIAVEAGKIVDAGLGKAITRNEVAIE